MTCMGFGKTAEGILITAAMLSERIGSPTVYYNGAPITDASGYGFDTQPFDDVTCALNVGTVLGALVTLKNSLLHSTTDDPSAASAITGASFTDANSSSDECIKRGSVLCKDQHRYFFLKTEVQGTPCTVDFGATWIAGHARQEATAQPLEFDV